MKRVFTLFTFLLVLAAAVDSVSAQARGEVLIKNATVMTAVRGTLEGTDILIRDGKIVRIGKGLTAGSSATTFDATGKYVTPGIIDAHSHTMLSAINEGSLAVTSMTDVKEMLDPTDITIYRALAGGVTSALLLHGSANPIGGQSATVKFKWGRPAADYLIPDAPLGIKFALGENVKRSSQTQVQPGQTFRYPRTRMGTMEVIRDAFRRARDYKQSWDDFRAKKTKIPPRVDEELQPLVEIMEGKRLVHCHGYRSDEHLNIMKIAEEFGFKIGTLQHALEAYKIAPEVAKHGAGASIFADSWSYKLEAYDNTPYNAYMLWKAGVVVSINSDSDERMRRLNLDAAKAMKYGGVPEEEALKMITLNPAKQLGIDKRTGSIEQGKDGDIVIWNAHPFSPYSSPDVTMIEGEVFFDRGRDKLNRALLAKEREDLEKLDVNRAPGSGGTPPARPTERRIADRDEADRGEVGGNNQ
jgi:imidazolonepropionase-like amidohydrolase